MVKIFRSRSGFSLIELIIVVVIAGILAGIAAPIMSAIKEKGYESEARTNIGAIKATEDAYFIRNHSIFGLGYDMTNLDALAPLGIDNPNVVNGKFWYSILSVYSGSSAIPTNFQYYIIYAVRHTDDIIGSYGPYYLIYDSRTKNIQKVPSAQHP